MLVIVAKMLRIIIYAIFLLNICAIAIEVNENTQLTPIRPQLSNLNAQQDGQRSLQNNSDSHQVRTYPRNCAEVAVYSLSSGIHNIRLPNYFRAAFQVACDATTQGGGWTIILSRMDGSVDFYRNWNNYKRGFGDLDGEFFLGLDKIHALTAEFSQELLVLLEDFQGVEVFEKYDKFAIGDEDEQYALNTLGKANGTAGDSLSYNHQQKFTTFDRDNDSWELGNCAENSRGAWWYNRCTQTNLAGTYNGISVSAVSWQSFREYNNLKRVIMMIRPRKTA